MDENLSAAFGTPARAELSGLLPPRRTTETPRPTRQAPPPETRQDEPVRQNKPAASGDVGLRPSPAMPVEDESIDTVTTQVSAYLTPAAVTAVRKSRGRGTRTNADVAFDAIDATIDRLPKLIEARRTGPDKPGSLFPARRRHTSSENRVLWSLKATPAELEVIDQLVETTGARSRSELIATAVEAHLLRSRRRK